MPVMAKIVFYKGSSSLLWFLFALPLFMKPKIHGFFIFINGFCKLPIDFQCTHPSICLFPCATFRSLVSSSYCLLNTEFHQPSICLFHQSFYISFMSSPCLQVLRFKHLPKCKALIFIKDTIGPLTDCRGIPVYTFPLSLKYTFHYYSLFSVIYPIC